ncbi:MAG: YlxR family protein [Ilumatobacteraceae bacterium]
MQRLSRTRPLSRRVRISAEGPHRTCVGCRRSRPQAELIRCVHSGSPSVSRTAPGRGAWVCGIDCARIARAGSFERAWRRPVGDKELAKLLTELESV